MMFIVIAGDDEVRHPEQAAALVAFGQIGYEGEICIAIGVRRSVVFHPAWDRSIIGNMGRMLIYLGMLFIAAGLVVIVLGRMGVPLGHLPGDITFRGKNASVFAPIGSSILLSILLSLLLYVVARLLR
jgi:Protein of unknown function (DUF2905)